DGEHCGVGVERALEMLRACDSIGAPAIVRVPRNDEATILTYLDVGAQTVLVPHVKDAADARRVVRAVKYGPEGTRGSHGGNRAAGYGLSGATAEILAELNRQTMAIPLIEEVE